MIERDLPGRRLKPGERFHFACRPELECFNSCCRDKRLPLLPYDMLRLRRGLNRASPDILAELVELEADPTSGWPALRIKLADGGVCPFVTAQGCAVYEHRPTCCRVYPLARAVAPGKKGRPPEEFYLVQDAPGCQGWQENAELTAESWAVDQGLPPYLEAHNRALGLFMHPRRPRRVELNPRQTHAYIAALYNLDVFRQGLDQPGFAKRLGLSADRLEAARLQDEALLDLGLEWLTKQLFR